MTRPLLILLLLTSVGSSLLIGAIWNIARNASFNQELYSFRAGFVTERRDAIEEFVGMAAAYAALRTREADSQLRAHLQTEVSQAHDIITALYDRLRGTMPPSEVKKLILETLRPLRFNQGRGYFFVVDLVGVELLYPIAPEFEGKNILGLQDESGTYVIRDEIRVVKESGEGFTEGYWKKPGISGDARFRKLSFVKLFEPFDWYIGAGDYIDEIDAATRAETLTWLATLRFSQGNTFLYSQTFEGKLLFSNGEILEGGAQNPITAERGSTILDPQVLKDIEANPAGRFFELPTTNASIGDAGPLPVRTVFAIGIPSWRWVLAAEFRSDEINLEIRDRNQKFRKEMLVRTFSIGLVSLAAAIIGSVFSIMMSTRLSRALQAFMREFEKSALALEPMKAEFRWSEFSTIATSANTIIAGRKLIDNDLRASLAKEEMLVREIHHRVKNNLAIISSLIRLRSAHLETDADRFAMRDIEQRMEAIAMIHARLYRGKDMENVDMADYMIDLGKNLSGMIPGSARISLIARADPLSLPNDIAVTVGLLFSEAATNALKHAFKNRPDGRLELSLLEQGDELVMRVADNGVGLPPDALSGSQKSLGMVLINSLAEQLGGSLSLSSDGGAVITVTFPKPVKKI